MLHDSTTVADAVRLLHAITRKQHVQKYRARRLREIYNASMDSADRQQWDHDRPWLMGFRKGKPSGPFSSLLLLLQLYARYDPDGCGQHFPHGIKLIAELSRYLRCKSTGVLEHFVSEVRSTRSDVSRFYIISP